MRNRKTTLAYFAIIFLSVFLIIQLALPSGNTETFDFNDGNGPVPAARHINPDGSTGGWVAETATASTTAIIGRNAVVFGNANVSGNARIFEQARIHGRATVTDNAWVTGTAQVYDNAMIAGDAWIGGAALISDNQKIPTGAYDENGPIEVRKLPTEPAQQAWHYVWVPGPNHNQ